ncbi:MAG TPA: YDG domain-containing protein, partial [Cytophagales bacterium]
MSKVYGDGEPPLTGTLEGFLARDQVTATYSRIAGETVNRGPYTISATLSPAGVLGNYSINSKTADFTITPRPLTVTATAKDKVYDGNATAQVTLTDNRVPGDEISVLFTSAAFADKNAGTGKTVTVNGLSIMGFPGNYSLASPVVTTTADITPRGIAGSFTAGTKEYDGTTSAVVGTRSVTGVLPGDQVSLTGGTAHFADKNVGNNKPVTLTGATLTGAQAANYTLSSLTLVAMPGIYPKGITPAITAADKVYDGAGNATITSRSLVGVVDGDAVTLEGGTAFFEDPYVGTGKAVRATGFGLSGADAGNYLFANGQASTQAAITPLAVAGTFTAASKVYDGNTFTNVNSRNLPGLKAGDQVFLTGGTAHFADKNAGNGKTVTLTGAALTGAQAGNYTLSGVAPATANITRKDLIPAFTAEDKVYDGKENATIKTRSLSGVVAGDQVDLVGGAAFFEN